MIDPHRCEHRDKRALMHDGEIVGWSCECGWHEMVLPE